MEKLPCNLINIPGFEALQPSDDTDWEIDQLLSQVPDPAIICPQIPYIPEPPEFSLPAPASMWSLEPTPSSRFAKPFSDKEIQNLRKRAIPANTQKSTSFAVNVWKEWSACRRKMNLSDWPAHLLIMNDWELDLWLAGLLSWLQRRTCPNVNFSGCSNAVI